MTKPTREQIESVINRLPSNLVPNNYSWASTLTAITRLKTEYNNAIIRVENLEAVIREVLEDNLDLTDGDNCTLIKLKKSINFDETRPLSEEQVHFQRWCD